MSIVVGSFDEGIMNVIFTGIEFQNLSLLALLTGVEWLRINDWHCVQYFWFPRQLHRTASCALTVWLCELLHNLWLAFAKAFQCRLLLPSKNCLHFFFHVNSAPNLLFRLRSAASIIGSTEALPILCLRCARWERVTERERERERERVRRKWRHLTNGSAEIGDEFCTFPCQNAEIGDEFCTFPCQNAEIGDEFCTFPCQNAEIGDEFCTFPGQKFPP